MRCMHVSMYVCMWCIYACIACNLNQCVRVMYASMHACVSVMCVRVVMCVCVHLCVRALACTYMRLGVHTGMRACTHICMHMHE